MTHVNSFNALIVQQVPLVKDTENYLQNFSQIKVEQFKVEFMILLTVQNQAFQL